MAGYSSHPWHSTMATGQQGGARGGSEEALRDWDSVPATPPARDLVLSSELQCLQSLVDLDAHGDNSGCACHTHAEGVEAGTVAFRVLHQFHQWLLRPTPPLTVSDLQFSCLGVLVGLR